MKTFLFQMSSCDFLRLFPILGLVVLCSSGCQQAPKYGEQKPFKDRSEVEPLVQDISEKCKLKQPISDIQLLSGDWAGFEYRQGHRALPEASISATFGNDGDVKLKITRTINALPGLLDITKNLAGQKIVQGQEQLEIRFAGDEEKVFIVSYCLKEGWLKFEEPSNELTRDVYFLLPKVKK